MISFVILCIFFFFFNDTATTEIYTLSLHDALPISPACRSWTWRPRCARCSPPATIAALDRRRPSEAARVRLLRGARPRDRKSTRLNSSHANISYAVFCLKKKKKHTKKLRTDTATYK